MFSSIFEKASEESPRLVVGLNQVDKMIVEGWNEKLNAPKEEAEKEIKRRSQDLIKRFSKISDISANNIEYYSALKRYRLIPLLSKIIRNAYAGFKLDNIQPADPFELAGEDVQEFVKAEREKRIQSREGKQVSGKERVFDELQKILSEEDLNTILSKFKKEQEIPPKVAIFGKAGVGKTTTINNLFDAKWKTSHTFVGTTEAQMKEFELSTGGTLNILDLPGYGRSLSEDKEYEKIYKELIPSCDLVFLVVQANTRDFADDEEMINKVSKWLKEAPHPDRK